MVMNWLKNNLYIAIAVGLAALVIQGFISGDSICLFKRIGWSCYGCGITRAIWALIHFQFDSAMQYNKLCVIVFPLLVYVGLKHIRNPQRDTAGAQ